MATLPDARVIIPLTLASQTSFMVPIRRRLQALTDSEAGQALIEYSLIVCLVVVVVLATLIVLGNQVQNTYCNIMGAVVRAGS